MTEQTIFQVPDEGAPDRGLDAVQTAHLEMAAGPARLDWTLRVAPTGLLAIGAMVSGILLSSAVIVWTATSVARGRAARSGTRPSR